MSVATITSQAALRTKDLERRRDAVREKMREAGIDVVICYGSGYHSFVAMNPGWYVSGFKQMGRHMAVILPAEGDLTMIMTPPWDLARARERLQEGLARRRPEER